MRVSGGGPSAAQDLLDGLGLKPAAEKALGHDLLVNVSPTGLLGEQGGLELDASAPRERERDEYGDEPTLHP
jgi:hypothetical protein